MASGVGPAGKERPPDIHAEQVQHVALTVRADILHPPLFHHPPDLGSVAAEFARKAHGRGHVIEADVPRRAEVAYDIHEVTVGVGRIAVRVIRVPVAGLLPVLGRVPPQVLLSFKTKAAMTAGAVGDIMKGAFKSLDIEGSGHRLRAHYATMTAARLWDECFAMNGYRFDQTVVNMPLDRLAEALGHSKVTTTVRFYLDMALLKHFGVENRAKLDAVRVIWDAVVQRQGSLSEPKMRLILKVVDGLAATPDGAELEQVITMAVEDGTLNPSANQPAPSVPVEKKDPPKLRLVE